MINIPPVNGVIVPALTFFNEKFEINEELNSLLIRHIILNGANALYLFGTTGEGIYFSNNLEEKIKNIDLTIKASNNLVPILVGVYGSEPDEILDQIDQLGTRYSDISFVVPPPVYAKKEVADLKSFYETILGSVNVKNLIYLYNNPNIFGGNNIDPNIVSWLISFDNLAGIKNSSDKISLFKAYGEYLSEEFGVYCGREGRFSTFLQIIPTEKRIYSGIVPSISNIVNLCSTLFEAAVHEETLDVIRLQDELNDFRKKIYAIQDSKGKQQRGLKHAFYSLYREIISSPLEDVFNVAPELQKHLEAVTLDRINATINSLKNMNYIQRYYTIGESLYNIYDFNNIVLEIEELKEAGAISKIKGPYEGKNNIIYRLKSDKNDLVLRAKLSKTFQNENIIKEKLLFPFLDNTLNSNLPHLRDMVKSVLSHQKGNYFFDKEEPPIVPVGDLLYFDETKEIIPYQFTIQRYIKGKPLFFLLEKSKAEKSKLNTTKFWNLFIDMGEILGILHEVKFNTFYEKITEIGKKKQTNWVDLFNTQLETEFRLAKKNKIGIIDELKNYFRDNESLIEDEEAVLFHNDYHSQNIIVNEEATGYKVKGLINFDNWRVGVRAADFSKMLYWTIDPLNEPSLKEAFYQGYVKVFQERIEKEFEKKIKLYTVFWLLKVYNFEYRNESQLDHKHSVSMRFPATENYLRDIKKIILE